MTRHSASRRHGRVSVAITAAAIIAPWIVPAGAAPPSIQIPAEDAFSTEGGATGPFAFVSDLPRSSYMLGDMWGLRTKLAKYGISFALQETSEVLGNVTGGARRGAAYDGLTQMALQVDTRRAFGLYGALSMSARCRSTATT